MPLLLLPSASNQKHPPFPEWRRGKDGDSGVCNIEDRLLQRRSPGTEFGLDWSSSACDEFGSSLAPEAAKILTHICSNEGRAALAPCFPTDPVQGHTHDVEVYRWVRAGLSARFCHLLSTISDRRQTRSSVASRFLLEIPRARTVTMQKRAFAYAGPTLWNNMPEAIRSSALLVSPDTIKNTWKPSCSPNFDFHVICYAE